MTVDGGTLGLWQVIVPKAGTNLVTNPSFETNTTGWATTLSTISRVVGGAFGGYTGRLLATLVNGRAEFNGGQSPAGTPTVASVYMVADSPLVVLRLQYSGGPAVDQAHPGDGKLHRLEVTTPAVSSSNAIIGIVDTRTGSFTNIDFDGVQFEVGASVASTYMDGDQEGCVWTGLRHASTTTRDGRDGNGGTITSFTSLGMLVTAQAGLGYPEVNIAATDLAINDGQVYQRTIKKARQFTLTTEILYASGLIADLHTTRRAVLAAINPDVRTNRGPVLLRYNGSAVPKLTKAQYQAGFEMNAVDPTTDVSPLRFMAPDPDFFGEIETQLAISANGTLSSVAYIAIRYADGTWSNMAGGVPGCIAHINACGLMANGSVVVGSASGPSLYVWNGTAWSQLGNLPNGTVLDVLVAPNGDLYISGGFTTVDSVTVNRVAKYVPATTTWSALSTGATSGSITDLLWDFNTGNLWAFGTFTSIGGVTTTGGAYWDGAAWHAGGTGVGLPAAGVYSKAFGPDGNLYIGSTDGVYRWSGSAWSRIWATTNGPAGTAIVHRLSATKNRMYAGGTFASIGGVTATHVAVYQGGGWSPLGSGIVSSSTLPIYSINEDASGLVYAGGWQWTSAGGIVPPDNIAIWNGSTWQPADFNTPNTATPANDFAMTFPLPNRSTVVAWDTSSGSLGTSLTYAGITSVTNDGTAPAWPVFDFIGCLGMYVLANLTTGQTIRFNGTVQANETMTLDLRPGRKTFRSTVRDGASMILPGGDLATFYLAPGANQIACYVASGTVIERHRRRYASVD